MVDSYLVTGTVGAREKGKKCSTHANTRVAPHQHLHPNKTHILGIFYILLLTLSALPGNQCVISTRNHAGTVRQGQVRSAISHTEPVRENGAILCVLSRLRANKGGSDDNKAPYTLREVHLGVTGSKSALGRNLLSLNMRARFARALSEHRCSAPMDSRQNLKTSSS